MSSGIKGYLVQLLSAYEDLQSQIKELNEKIKADQQRYLKFADFLKQECDCLPQPILRGRRDRNESSTR